MLVSNAWHFFSAMYTYIHTFDFPSQHDYDADFDDSSQMMIIYITLNI